MQKSKVSRRELAHPWSELSAHIKAWSLLRQNIFALALELVVGTLSDRNAQTVFLNSGWELMFLFEWKCQYSGRNFLFHVCGHSFFFILAAR